ncbi:MAG TPA: A24 family peptidase [Caulobacteraceae bacterium]
MTFPATATIAALFAAVPSGWAAARVARRCAEDATPPSTALVMLATVAVFAWAALTVSENWVLAVSLALGWTLVCLTAVDLVCLRLPDPLTLPLIAAGLAVSLALPGRPILDHLAGAAAGYAVLAALAWAFRWFRGVEGVGLGDAKLLAAAGAWLGWRLLPSVLLIACVAAFVWIAVSVVLRGWGVARGPIAFGAPLCLAFWVVWLGGPLTP